MKNLMFLIMILVSASLYGQGAAALSEVNEANGYSSDKGDYSLLILFVLFIVISVLISIYDWFKKLFNKPTIIILLLLSCVGSAYSQDDKVNLYEKEFQAMEADPAPEMAKFLGIKESTYRIITREKIDNFYFEQAAKLWYTNNHTTWDGHTNPMTTETKQRIEALNHKAYSLGCDANVVEWATNNNLKPKKLQKYLDKIRSLEDPESQRRSELSRQEDVLTESESQAANEEIERDRRNAEEKRDYSQNTIPIEGGVTSADKGLGYLTQDNVEGLRKANSEDNNRLIGFGIVVLGIVVYFIASGGNIKTK